MSRILAISDIHGHAEGARSLLRMADYVPGTDRLYLLGDFIDRDRDTWSALAEVRQWTAEGARALLGNMERWLLELSSAGDGDGEGADGVAGVRVGAGESAGEGADGVAEVRAGADREADRGLGKGIGVGVDGGTGATAEQAGAGLPENSEDLLFLRKTPLYWRDGEKWLFVHAGIRPGVPLEAQMASDLTGIRQEFWGRQAQGGSAGSGKGRRQIERLPYTVVFGHTPTFKLGAPAGELWFGPDRIGIDTGAKHGCRLTLVDLTGGLAYSCSTAHPGRYTDYRISPFSAFGN